MQYNEHHGTHGTTVNGGITTSSVMNSDSVTASILASRDVYRNVFDTIYVQHQAMTPNYDIVNAEADESAAKGEQVTVQFNTAKYVEDVVVVNEEGEEIKLDSLTCDVDESKILSDDYQNAKTWTAEFTVTEEGENVCTVKAADGEGETASFTVGVKPAAITSLRIVSAPAKTNYNYKDSIDTTGLVLEATYTDGTVKQIRSGYTLNTYRANHLGQKTITVNYDGMTATFKIKTTMSFAQLIATIFGFGWLFKK